VAFPTPDNIYAAMTPSLEPR